MRLLEDFFLKAKPHSFRMWLASWMRCPSCGRRKLKYMRSHGGVICLSQECEGKKIKLARLIAEHIKFRFRKGL